MEPLFKKRKAQLDAFKHRLHKGQPITPKEFPEHVVKQCEACHECVLYDDLMHHQYVCPSCGYHHKISARERLRQVCDPKSFHELDAQLSLREESSFPGYEEKLSQNRAKSGMKEAVITGIAKIAGHKVVFGVMDAQFMMGSMGAVVGEKITRAIETATRKKYPLILFTASGGARMQEGIVSLVQMAKTSAAIRTHQDAGLLYISVMTNPTTGGVLASFAMLGDLQIAEPGALIGFAGKRVIESTINEVLPKEFQTAEFVLEKGFLDCIVARKEMRSTLAKFLRLHKGESA